MTNAERPTEAVFDMVGFGCVSCMYAIERIGARFDGVSTVRVDLAKHEIRLTYDGTPGTLDKLRDLVRMLGHEVVLRNG